jgi:hypothetical protein
MVKLTTTISDSGGANHKLECALDNCQLYGAPYFEALQFYWISAENSQAGLA